MRVTYIYVLEIVPSFERKVKLCIISGYDEEWENIDCKEETSCNGQRSGKLELITTHYPVMNHESSGNISSVNLGYQSFPVSISSYMNHGLRRTNAPVRRLSGNCGGSREKTTISKQMEKCLIADFIPPPSNTAQFCCILPFGNLTLFRFEAIRRIYRRDKTDVVSSSMNGSPALGSETPMKCNTNLPNTRSRTRTELCKILSNL
ncbi:hypothetical protein NPIL_268001 [Nephila pilipes]|uniref:Uncharacterized protein n=1 Tax=Nephila pilipes TaxID=299642 RepID=A0A8X6UQK3_NEPPI|nr:hypothetical protein NPIL_268001 [Nephila pilipes]